MADFIFKISPNIMLGTYLSSRLGQYAKDYANRYIGRTIDKAENVEKLKKSIDKIR